MKNKITLSVLFLLMLFGCEKKDVNQDLTFHFPQNKMGHFAKAWFKAINSYKKSAFEEYLKDQEWASFFSQLLELSKKKQGIEPVMLSYETPEFISIYAKENRGSWVKVNLGLSDKNEITAMGIKKSVEPIDYKLKENLSPIHITEIVKTIVNQIKSNYVVKKERERLSQFLLKNLELGKYNHITQGDLLAEKLTEDLIQISNDKHLQVIPPSRIKEVEMRFGSSANHNKTIKTNISEKNNLIIDGRVENNVGIISLERFVFNKEVVAQTEKILSEMIKCKAIVIDLRYSGGGDGQAVNDLLSYFFTGKQIKNINELSKSVVLNSKPINKNFAEKPLFVLTSKKTISAGEAFAYFLKQKNRATIIGETTAGAGYLVDAFEMAHKFYFVNSIYTKFNPEKNEGWQGKGIKPDVQVAHIKGLEKALELISQQ